MSLLKCMCCSYLLCERTVNKNAACFQQNSKKIKELYIMYNHNVKSSKAKINASS